MEILKPEIIIIIVLIVIGIALMVYILSETEQHGKDANKNSDKKYYDSCRKMEKELGMFYEDILQIWNMPDDYREQFILEAQEYYQQQNKKESGY